MRLFFIALLLVSLAMAFNVKPEHIETQDTGNAALPKLNVDITIDCDNKALTVGVSSNQSGAALAGAKAYLFYTDYTYQALPNPGTTDADGIATIPVPGTIRFLTALFILRVDATGYQSREIELTYEKCFEEPPTPPPPSAPDTTNQTSPPPPDVTPPNQTPPEPDITPPAENQTNQTVPQPAPPEPSQTCLPALLLMALVPAMLSRR